MLSRFFYVLIFTLCLGTSQAQLRLCSWNIQNFGKSKSDSAITFMSEQLRNFDVVALVEVVAGNGGAQAVARLADELNRTGSKWDYCVSDPTCESEGCTERYAFLWKTSKVKKMGDAWLEQKYKTEIIREPYFARFNENGMAFTLAVYHALPKSKQPETEIKYLQYLPALYPGETILFCGDFNCPESHTVFNPLKSMGFQPALKNQKTTLKNECKGTECLASMYDNVFFEIDKIEKISSGVVEFQRAFPNNKAARKISDHLPIYLVFKVK